MITQRPAELRRGGFTILELMISLTLMGIILAGVLGAFVFLAKSGVNMYNYADMEAQARKALELFAQDSRQASDIAWSPNAADQTMVDGVSMPTKVTFIVDGVLVMYAWNSSSKDFVRTTPTKTTKLLTGVDRFELKGFQIINPSMDPAGLDRASVPIGLSTISSNEAARLQANKLTKQVQISLRMKRGGNVLAQSTDSVLSARFILRNKLITN